MHTHTHTGTHTCNTHNQPHTQSKDKWEGELQAMKEVRLESGPKRMTRICLPDAPGQGIPFRRGDISEGSLVISLCLTVLGPRNSK